MHVEITPNVAHELLKKQLSDPQFLAGQVQGWRKIIGASQEEAAYWLDIPLRTLQGIEHGRGFRYPVMLWETMHALEKELEKIMSYTPAQMRSAEKDMVRAGKLLAKLEGSNGRAS